jgi:integrase
MRKPKSFYGATRQEARDKLVAAQVQTQQGVPLPDKMPRLEEYLNYWLAEVVKPGKRYATYDQCERTVRLYLTPALGTLPLVQLSVPLVQQFLNEMLANGHSIPKVQVIRKVLSASLTCAMREELITRNVARLTILPTYEPEDNEPWTADELRYFLVVSQSDRLYPAFVLLFLYGLRRGEVLGLRWLDIDFVRHIMRIRQQLQRADYGLQLAQLKTKAGRRDLALLHSVEQILLAHQRQQEQDRRADGAAWVGHVGDEGFVFPAEHGKPMEASTLVRAFRKVCRRHGLRRVRVHDARDGLGTLLSELDIPVKQVQVILGHSRATTTLQYYQHGRIEKQRASLAQVRAVLLPGNEKDDEAGESPRLGCGRSRQASRQMTFFVDIITTPISGAGDGTLTRGLVLGKSTLLAIRDRLTEVNRALEVRGRLWRVGIVAVNASRQPDVLRVPKLRERRSIVSASSMHLPRTSAGQPAPMCC